MTLSSVPADCVRSWAAIGFSHIWLMGVWQSGPRAAAHARNDKGLRQRCRELGVSLDALGPSPYAIARYDVAPEIGTREELLGFREMLHKHGLRLMLDFVPNHVGLDHPWIDERPDYFVCGARRAEGSFARNTASGRRHIAHGKDPYFPAWTDTAQLDFRLVHTQEAVLGELLKVAEVCDGVRCDMAMLVLNGVFHRTWCENPAKGELAKDEFWTAAIRSVRERCPQFLFLAEAYWGLEATLLDMGFDYAYDKTLTDLIFEGDGLRIAQHVHRVPRRVLERSAHFLENHDEQRANGRLPLDAHRAAALLTLMLPGMRFLYQGQLEGARLRVPVQLRAAQKEVPDDAVRRMYDQLLRVFRETDMRLGHARMLDVPIESSHSPGAAVLAPQWTTSDAQFTIAAVNLGKTVASCTLHPEPPGPPGDWMVLNHLEPGGALTWRSGPQGFPMVLHPLQAAVLQFRRSARRT